MNPRPTIEPRRGGLPTILVIALITTGCAVMEPGITVTVEAEVTVPDSDTLTIDEAHLSLASIELLPCEASLLASLTSGFTIPTAQAHTEAGETGFMTDATLDLRRAGIHSVGRLQLAPERFCHVAIVLESHRFDAPTVQVSGTHHGTAFSIRSFASISRVLPLDPPLVVDSQNRSPRLTLSLDPASWLSALDMAGMPADLVEQTLLATIEQRLRVIVTL